MRDINELAIELAKIYGIEIIDEPNKHVIVNEKGEEVLLQDNYYDAVFGIFPPNEEIVEIGHKKGTFRVKEVETSFSKSLQSDVDLKQNCDNSKYAMAA
jgi:hypothetical protein